MREGEIRPSNENASLRLSRRSLLAAGAGVCLIGGGTAGALAQSYRDTNRVQSTVNNVPLTDGIQVWWSGPESSPRLALTFDDGPTAEFTAEVLSLLQRYQVPATFFVIGALVERHQDLARRIRDEGHEFGNHTYGHVSAAKLDGPAVRADIARGADVIAAVAGQRPRWLRPPRGEVTTATLLAAREQHHDVAMWSVTRGDSDDSDGAGVRQQLQDAPIRGSIIDLHDGIGRSAFDGTPDQQLITRRRTEIDVLPDAVASWKAEGFELVTLSELIPPGAVPTQSAATVGQRG